MYLYYIYNIFLDVLFKNSSKIWNARNNKRGCSIQHTATNLWQTKTILL